MEYNSGQMVPIMKVNGPTIKPTAMELSGMLRETSIVVNLRMTWLTDMVTTPISTGAYTEANSEMTCKKVTAKKHGLMAPNMWEAMPTA